jgi:hypothetical protein
MCLNVLGFEKYLWVFVRGEFWGTKYKAINFGAELLIHML